MGFFKVLLVALASLLPLVQIATQPFVALIAETEVKQELVYVTNTGKRYHRAQSRYLRLSSHPMSVREARTAGYTSCHVCHPAALLC